VPTNLSAPPTLRMELVAYDQLEQHLSDEWAWLDPSGESPITLQRGAVIQAARGTDLWLVNLRAPRLLRSAQGDWYVQAICRPALLDMPSSQTIAAGSLLVWQDQDHYSRLNVGSGGERELVLMECINDRDLVIGRCRLPTWLRAAGQVFLGMRRLGERIDAYCGVDGDTWFSVGSATPGATAVQVGMYAKGLKGPIGLSGQVYRQHRGALWLLWVVARGTVKAIHQEPVGSVPVQEARYKRVPTSRCDDP
jgi:hypothetical protein